MDPRPADPERDASAAPDATGPSGVIPGAGQTALISFSNPDEFLAELRDRGPNVDGVLRLTFRLVADQSGAPISDLWVVANYLRRVEAGVLAVVRLDHFVGGVWHDLPDQESERHRMRAEALRQRIKREAEALGAEVRAGTHQLPPAKRRQDDPR